MHLVRPPGGAHDYLSVDDQAVKQVQIRVALSRLHWAEALLQHTSHWHGWCSSVAVRVSLQHHSWTSTTVALHVVTRQQTNMIA